MCILCGRIDTKMIKQHKIHDTLQCRQVKFTQVKSSHKSQVTSHKNWRLESTTLVDSVVEV